MILWRHKVYDTLVKYNIPVVRHFCVIKDEKPEESESESEVKCMY